MNILIKFMQLYESLVYKFYVRVICKIFFEKKYKKISDANVKSIRETAIELINTNKSIGRYGDGELSWMFGKNNGVDNFEKTSKELSIRLLEVFNSNRDDFIITLPDGMKNPEKKNFTKGALEFWKYYITKRAGKLSRLIDKDKVYYNTSITRPYIDYNCNSYAKETYSLLKQVWNNKKILIVEGKQSRLGYNDDLFDGCQTIKRIECPVKNAFEHYDEILDKTLSFLDDNEGYLTLISLGPTATILAYDLCKNGHRSLDVGHIDAEYEWYLMGAKEKVNLPNKYINETRGNKGPINLVDNSHDDEIVYKI